LALMICSTSSRNVNTLVSNSIALAVKVHTPAPQKNTPLARAPAAPLGERCARQPFSTLHTLLRTRGQVAHLQLPAVRADGEHQPGNQLLPVRVQGALQIALERALQPVTQVDAHRPQLRAQSWNAAEPDEDTRPAAASPLRTLRTSKHDSAAMRRHSTAVGRLWW